MSGYGELTRVGSVLSGMPQFQELPPGGTCARCSQEYLGLPEGSTDQICDRCASVVEQGERILARAAELVDAELLDAGLAAREREASIERIPAEIRRKLPHATARALLAGEAPQVGFGLSGTPGIGKTMALAVLVARYGRARLERLARAGESRRLRGWLAWATWKATTERMRALSLQDGGHAEVNRLVERYSAAEIVVIDDLGAERIRGSYADDWATSMLDRIVDARDREIRPVWYTTNLGREALQKLYGSRLWSRLCGVAPLVELGAGPDLRLRR